MRIKLSGILLALSVLLLSFSFVAGYPTKPITLINPMPPGGFLDIQARAFAPVAERILGQPVVVINQAGATEIVRALSGAQAAPDGYTLTVGSSNIPNAVEWELANARKPPFTRHDFVCLGTFTMSPPLLIVPKESPYKTLTDLIAVAKARPGEPTFSSGGLYGMSHLPVEILSRSAGVKFRHVPYSGERASLMAVVSKQVDFSVNYPTNTLPLLRGDKLRALTVIGAKRLRSAPDISTAKELGFDAEYSGWVGLLAPVKTPKPVVDRLRQVLKSVAENRAFMDMIEGSGDEVRFLTGDELTRYIAEESARLSKFYAEMIKESPK